MAQLVKIGMSLARVVSHMQWAERMLAGMHAGEIFDIVARCKIFLRMLASD